MSEAIVRDFEVRIGRKLKEREAGVLSELVEKAERELAELNDILIDCHSMAVQYGESTMEDVLNEVIDWKENK